MDSFTFGSDEFMQAVITKGTERKYPIELNATDFEVFARILRQLALYSEVNHHEFQKLECLKGFGSEDIEAVEDWAWQFLSSVAESLGIEGV